MAKVTYELGDGSTTTRTSSDPTDEIPVPEGAIIVEDEGSGEISEFADAGAQMMLSLRVKSVVAQRRANGEIRAVEMPDVELVDADVTGDEVVTESRRRRKRKGDE